MSAVVYHVTRPARAREILADGFSPRDAIIFGWASNEVSVVRLSQLADPDVRADFARAGALLEVTLPADVSLDAHRWPGETGEWIVPLTVVQRGRIRLLRT